MRLNHFIIDPDMKDLGNASFILRIEIHMNTSRTMSRLSQRSYIKHIIEKFIMVECKPRDTFISYVDKHSKDQCPRNEIEKLSMKD